MVFSRNAVDALPGKGPAALSYDSFVTLQGHTKGIWGMVQLSDGRICSAGSDNDLRVWSRDMKSCEKVLKGHTNSVGKFLCHWRDASYISFVICIV